MVTKDSKSGIARKTAVMATQQDILESSYASAYQISHGSVVTS